MPSYTWTSAASGNWSTAADWTPNGIPGAGGGDTALINATGANYTITYDEASETLNSLSAPVNSLTINSAAATLAFNANDTLGVFGNTLLQAGTIDLLTSGSVLSTGTLTTSSGTTLNIGTNGTLTYNIASVGGLVDLAGTTSFGTAGAGITLNGTIEATGGTGTVAYAGISGAGTLEANGGTLLVTSRLGGVPVPLVIANSAASVFEDAASEFDFTSISASFLGPQGEFRDATTSGASLNYKIGGLNAGGSTTTPTNFIQFAGHVVTINSGGSGPGTTGSIVLSNSDTLTLSGITGIGTTGWVAESISDGAGGTDIFLASVCYAGGTRILTAAGEKAVESLRPGDIVMTRVGEDLVACPLKWLGRRRIDLAAHPRPDDVAPVRIQRDALADTVPHRDLYVSPNHGILIDGRLICARQLINGETIRQVRGWKSVDYFHVELDEHAILLAEGLPAESYLDTGNRGFFANANEPRVLHPDLASDADYPTREAASCHPFVWDEASVRPVWRRLAERAAKLGQPLDAREITTDAALRVLVNGRALHPLYVGGGLHIVVLPTGAADVRLVSRACSPTDARPWLTDRRCLGVCVERIVLRGRGGVQEIPMDHSGLSLGWWPVEQTGTALRRWTNGNALLALPTRDGPMTLEIRAGAGGMAYSASDEQLRAARPGPAPGDGVRAVRRA